MLSLFADVSSLSASQQNMLLLISVNLISTNECGLLAAIKCSQICLKEKKMSGSFHVYSKNESLQILRLELQFNPKFTFLKVDVLLFIALPEFINVQELT
jgi:hypothetical protein